MTKIAMPNSTPETSLIAPRWHTWLLAALFLALALSGALFQRHALTEPATVSQHHNMAPLYLSLIVMEWGLVLYVWKGTRRAGATLRGIIGGRWARPTDVIVDVAIGIGCWGIWRLVELIWNHWFGLSHPDSINAMLPRGAIETVLWIALSISAGFCEELTFRGYFLRQWSAMTHSRLLGLLLQAALFGIAHGYQGMGACLGIAAYGAGAGLLAIWRKSLRPGMVGHAWTDIASGLFGL